MISPTTAILPFLSSDENNKWAPWTAACHPSRIMVEDGVVLLLFFDFLAFFFFFPFFFLAEEEATVGLRVFFVNEKEPASCFSLWLVVTRDTTGKDCGVASTEVTAVALLLLEPEEKTMLACLLAFLCVPRVILPVLPVWKFMAHCLLDWPFHSFSPYSY